MPNEMISRIPPGSQDLLAGDVTRRRRVQAEWFRLAEERGYQEVIPPTFEYEEVFTLGAGPDLARQLVRFVDRDGCLVALRADFTSSIARVAATKLAAAPLPLRLCYAGKVYRQGRAGGIDRREVFQLGAELIGDESADADIELLRLMIDTLHALEILDFQVNLGEIQYIRPLLLSLEPSLAEAAREAIDRKDRATLRLLGSRPEVPGAVARALEELPELIGRGEVLERAAALALCDDATGAIDRLARIDESLTVTEREHIVYDLGEIRGLDYYTGIRFEVFIDGVGGSVGSGGRYDELLSLYGLDRPAVGFALETDALAELLVGEGP
ncbi:MAG: ATP phosphoribosyltransferase regulatory subunit [Gemmatimonas sp.]|nr:ATP phosphoribosyltransferase regulatory subunit [Gemmatimonas sp.]